MTRVGFIGLGQPGRAHGPPYHRCGLSRHVVRPPRRRPSSRLPARQLRVAASISDLAADVEHVGVCVVDDAGVQQVCDELLPALRPGACIAIHSTVHPSLCMALGARAAARGVSFIDAPVSGGAPAAMAGTLTVLVGGDASALAGARPIFATFASLIVRLGGVGAGQMAKLVNNAMMAAHLTIAHQAFAAVAALGLDRAAFTDIVKASSGRSFGFETYARLPAPSAFAHGAKLLAKDVRLLGEVLGDDPEFAALRDVAAPFLEFVQTGERR